MASRKHIDVLQGMQKWKIRKLKHFGQQVRSTSNDADVCCRRRRQRQRTQACCYRDACVDVDVRYCCCFCAFWFDLDWDLAQREYKKETVGGRERVIEVWEGNWWMDAITGCHWSKSIDTIYKWLSIVFIEKNSRASFNIFLLYI